MSERLLAGFPHSHPCVSCQLLPSVPERASNASNGRQQPATASIGRRQPAPGSNGQQRAEVKVAGKVTWNFQMGLPAEYAVLMPE
jgi:hypothetical protein